MESVLNIILIVLLSAVILLQVRAYINLKKKNKLILIQSREIKRQILEQEKRNKEVSDLVHDKQQLIGLVSHDLKGPFNRIFALIHLLELSSRTLSAEQKEYLGKIHQIAVDGLGMIRNLLDNRKLEDQGIEYTPEPLNLLQILNPLVKNYRNLADGKKIKILADLQQTPLMVFTDRLYLYRIIENLLSNALKFSPENKTISIRLEETPEFVFMKIKDEGPGISEDDQKKLYRKFQRLSARPTGGESSTGLGLFIVKALVDRMGSTITCESELGMGATFTVSVQRAKNEIS